MKNGLLASVALTAIIGSASVAHAEPAPSNEELAKEVKELQAQVQELTAALKQRPVATAAAYDAAPAPAPPSGTTDDETVGGGAKDIKTTIAPPSLRLDGALRAADAFGDSFRVQGRILIDAVAENVSHKNNQFAGQTRVADYHASNVRGRQVQIGASGDLGPKFSYLLEGGWQNGAAAQWAYAYVQYKFSPGNSLIVGNNKVVGIENITSEKYRTFMDAGPYGDLTDTSYVLSAAYVHSSEKWTFTAALQGASLNNPDVTAGALGSTSASERLSESVRGTWIPINTPTQKLHLGLWARYRERGGEGGLAYTAWPDTNFHSENQGGGSLMSAGAVGDADLTMAGEFAYVNGPLMLQAEAANMHVDRISTAQSATLGGPDFDIHTAYALISWSPTGEVKNYLHSGQFGRTTVLHPVDKGGIGGFEVAARWSFADLTDFKANTVSPPASQTSFATAGRYNAGTFALNWYPISYVKFAANYTFGSITNRQVGNLKNDAKVNVFQLRSQVDF